MVSNGFKVIQSVRGVLVVSWWRCVGGVEAVVLRVGWLCAGGVSLRAAEVLKVFLWVDHTIRQVVFNDSILLSC